MGRVLGYVLAIDLGKSLLNLLFQFVLEKLGHFEKHCKNLLFIKMCYFFSNSPHSQARTISRLSIYYSLVSRYPYGYCNRPPIHEDSLSILNHISLEKRNIVLQNESNQLFGTLNFFIANLTFEKARNQQKMV
jgi:hypothetical protein